MSEIELQGEVVRKKRIFLFVWLDSIMYLMSPWLNTQ
jgi:DNA-binding winged helix-turn-helix (wHTH) protein